MLVDGVRAAGGIWTLADLAEYEVAEREPTIARYGDMKIVSAPPPSSGGMQATLTTVTTTHTKVVRNLRRPCPAERPLLCGIVAS